MIKTHLTPTKKTEYFFGTIMMIVLIISLLNFPIFSLFSASPDTNVSLSVGWPIVFFELSMNDPGKMPIKIPEMIISLLIYFLVAYLLDITISLMIYASKPKDAIYNEAKKAYNYYIQNGKSKEDVIKMFKEKGWTEENLNKIIE